MNIRILFPASCSLALSFVCSVSSMAEEAKVKLLNKDGTNKDVFIIDYNDKTIRHHTSPQDLNETRTKRSDLDGVYFYEPAAFSRAMVLYNERQFEDAKKLFAKVESDFKSVSAALGNYSALAGFYKLECSRRLFDLESLSKDLAQFSSGSTLIRPSHQTQLELNKLWELVQLEEWKKLKALTQAWQEREVSNNQQAQIAYCSALATEKLANKNPAEIDEAMLLYSRAMVVDNTSSVELVVESATRMFEIYANDADVKAAKKAWGTDEENKSSPGYSNLLAANSLLRTYQLGGFENYKALPSAYLAFAEFELKEEKKVAAAPKTEEKKETEPAPPKKGKE